MKLKPFEEWLAPSLKEKIPIYTYIGIRFNERGRVGYKPTNPLITPKFPFVENCIDKNGVTEILEVSGLGMPSYYRWRSRSGCQFCFFQRRIEWIGLKENHPDQFEYAKSLEKSKATDEASAFTWIPNEPLSELEKKSDAIKLDYQKQLERLKKKKRENIDKNPFLKGEKNIKIEENLSQDDVSSSCLICHK